MRAKVAREAKVPSRAADNGLPKNGFLHDVSDLALESPSQRGRSLLSDVSQLPPLPDVAAEIMGSLTDEFVPMQRVAEILEKDPALTARILGLANSAFYCQPNEVTSIRDAIIRVLGLDLTRGIALGIALGGRFDTDRCPRFDSRSFWHQSMYRAAVNSHLTVRSDLGTEAKQLGFVAGLVAELGVLVLAFVAPDVLHEALSDPADIALEHRIEARLGLDQYTAGKVLAQAWSLPDALTAVIGNLNDAEYDGPHSGLVRITALSSAIAEHILGPSGDIERIEQHALELGIAAELPALLSGEADALNNIDGLASCVAR